MSERTAREVASILQALRHDATLTILRFSQYAEYPAGVALMSRTDNPATYYQEVLRFLHVDPDSGIVSQ